MERELEISSKSVTAVPVVIVPLVVPVVTAGLAVPVELAETFLPFLVCVCVCASFLAIICTMLWSGEDCP